MKTIMITGASGFIGRALCRGLCSKHRIIAVDCQPSPENHGEWIFRTGRIEDDLFLAKTLNLYSPDVVIHCAGLSHQKMWKRSSARTYEKINSTATRTLASAAVAVNPGVYFIFLSTISVYGENQGQKTVSEICKCQPTSDYANSKLNGERQLKGLYGVNALKKLDLLRLSPVYDTQWTLNLEKRVCSPMKLFYLRFGTGEQKISALARRNLVEFIDFRLAYPMNGPFCNTINICDENPYSFNEIIRIFRYQARRPVVRIPLIFIALPVFLAAMLAKKKSKWVSSYYNKLANDLVFDNKKMLDTGFKPRFSLKSVFIN